MGRANSTLGIELGGKVVHGTYTLHYNYVLRHWVFVLLTFVYKLQFIHSKKPSHERNIEIVWRALYLLQTSTWK